MAIRSKKAPLLPEGAPFGFSGLGVVGFWKCLFVHEDAALKIEEHTIACMERKIQIDTGIAFKIKEEIAKPHLGSKSALLLDFSHWGAASSRDIHKQPQKLGFLGARSAAEFESPCIAQQIPS